ncbi:SpoIIE family protein phosphatase [uncultured Desulfovibrio sp.]|uniref:PP2C family protein-serine/threonine phosphatase n=1 Tax=uncultured Desulfovibrio sp. TaxID=167968 RepID=UPI0026177AD1|nr:SpoIIE family protein phosphatase [uncultured Desulfovibrio sp.]
MTLRTKLSLSVGCAVALSIALTLFLTWQRVSLFVLSSEEAHFDSMAQTVENNLESSYQEYLAAKVRVVLSTKQQMRSMTLDVRNDLLALEENLPPSLARSRLGQALLGNHTRERSRMTDEEFSVTLATAEELRETGIPTLGVNAQSRSAKQQTIADILGNLPTEGEFALWPTTAGDEPLLLFFLPVDIARKETATLDSDRVLVSGLRPSSLFQEAETLRRSRLDAAEQNFMNMRFYDRGLLLLRDEMGQDLVKRGEAPELKGKLDALYAAARSQIHATSSVETDDGEYLCHVAWIQAYHWYFVMAAPLDVLRAPSSALVSRLLPAGLAILVVAALFTVFMVMRTIHPLAQLRDCTSELAALDPSSPSNLDDMESLLSHRLDLRRHDELGDLARSFAGMGRELTKNIRASMTAIAEQKRMEGELSAAKDIQTGILPDLNATPPEPGFAVAAFLEPAREVGGDLYDCFTLDDGRKALVMGDVSGKGVPAALFMTMSVTLVRYALRSGLDPAQALTQVNALLEEHNPGNMFVTLFLALYSPDTGGLLYANGGHCLPYVVDAQGRIRQLEKLSGPLVGAMPGVEYLPFVDALAPGEICFLYTDGLTEAMNADKELYGDERLAACLAAHATATPDALQKAVFADICAFRGEEPPSDDITMLTMCRHAKTGRDAA